MASSTSSYDPDPAAQLGEPWATAFLSQRDLSLAVPINFVTTPGISLAAACFADNQYLDGSAQRCISNLLAMGFRRFDVDLYWSAAGHEWSLCPVELSTSPDSQLTNVATATQVTSGPAPLSTAQLSEDSSLSNDVAAVTDGFADVMLKRQQSSSSSVGQPSSNPIPTASTSDLVTSPSATSTATFSAVPLPSSGPSVSLGPYNCTANLGVGMLTDVLAGFYSNTSNTLEAAFTYVRFNIHAAASRSSPTSPAPEPAASDLPGSSALISNLLSTNLSSYLYTPTELEQQRSNLNSSWYTASPSINYLQALLHVDVSSTGVESTPDGWPSESYAEFKNGDRLLVSFGSIDPQMRGYNFSGDAGTVFSPNSTASFPPVTVSTTGGLTSGCFFDSSITSISAQTNSSWAMSSALGSVFDSLPSNSTLASLANFTACGISPFLNFTVSPNISAATRPDAFIPFSRSANIWSWISGEPVSPGPNDSDTQNRCAAFFASDGRWRTSDCRNHHLAACRVSNSPYNWTITQTRSTFTDASELCPEGTEFSAPRTALENTYLLSALRSHIASHNGPSDITPDEPVFLNFQSLVTPDCWVYGVNSTCPYDGDADAAHNRTVIVPTVAAVIIFAITALTAFVKCTANRRNARRGRRRKGGERGDYEGVPS